MKGWICVRKFENNSRFKANLNTSYTWREQGLSIFEIQNLFEFDKRSSSATVNGFSGLFSHFTGI